MLIKFVGPSHSPSPKQHDQNFSLHHAVNCAAEDLQKTALEGHIRSVDILCDLDMRNTQEKCMTCTASLRFSKYLIGSLR